MIEIPKNIRTGEPLFTQAEWERMSDPEKAVCCYHNSPHRQRMTDLYRAIKEAGDDGG